MDELDDIINQMKEAGQISIEPAFRELEPLETVDFGVN